MEKRKYLKVWLITIFSLAIFVAGVSLAAYWSLSVDPPDSYESDTTVKVGLGGDVTTTINFAEVGEHKILVPATKVKDPNIETALIEFELKVIWTEEEGFASAKGGDFTADFFISHLVEGANPAAYNSLLIVEYEAPTTIDFDEELIINVRISLKLPDNYTEYYAIKGKEMTVTFTFRVTNPVEND